MSLNPWRPNTESFVKHGILADYIQDTAAKRGITEKIVFNTKVEHAHKENGIWLVGTRTWDNATEATTERTWVRRLDLTAHMAREKLT